MGNGRKFRFATFVVVAAIHAGGIFIPLGMMLLAPEKPKPIAFRVKLGGVEPSHAPEIGPPSRVRPAVDGGGGTQPSPPPPEKPLPPVSKKTPPPIPVKPVEKPKPKQKKTPKPRPKPKQKKTPKPKQKPKQKPNRRKQLEQQKRLQQEKLRRQQLERQKRLQQEKLRRQQLERQKRLQQEKLRRLQQQVHRDNSWDNWDPNKPAGGTNTNIAVPIGPRDRGQALGNVGGRTPAGGASADEEKYWNKLRDYLYERWQAPAGIFVSKETAVLFEISWDSRGRVLSWRIIKASPNPAVTQSVKMMLEHLDYIPSPPPGIADRVPFRMVSQ